ncbi:hypothetical protein B0T17DRAFT_616840 [Bombardia bombarda]|uniref:Uncharacterized protein n=1 Tax=Bombardia bombarda TaxID=252184 RepID=A0AA39WZU0_9PEZI|nr:hypothetical protein B0T17DRAFT_616840 [Bombardia bombarda]
MLEWWLEPEDLAMIVSHAVIVGYWNKLVRALPAGANHLGPVPGTFVGGVVDQSIRIMASYGGHSSGGISGKLTKTRARVKVVKPILKKLSHSEKNSLDLDRGWEDQSVEQLESVGAAWDGSHGRRSYSTARDVSFALSGPVAIAGTGDGSAMAVGGAAAITMVAGTTGGSGSSTRPKFQHGRSASQASTGSGSRAFIHPFQQTPRTATPPLSYANSLASFDNNGRDYSPTITENEDDGRDSNSQLTGHLQAHHHAHHHSAPPPTASQPNLRRPTLANQRTASYSDILSPGAPPLRVNTNRSTSSRLAHGSLNLTTSHSDLHLNTTLDSPTGSLGGTIAPPSITSPTSSVSGAAMSPLRTSIDTVGFPRLRSRSELDASARAENLRAARRRFEERERAKEEKYDREMIKKRERRDTREASRIEREAAGRKISLGDIARPSASRKTTPTNLSTASASSTTRGGAVAADSSSNDVSTASFWGYGLREAGGVPASIYGNGAETPSEQKGEKQMGFASRKYESVPGQALPAFGLGVDDVRFEPARPRRGSTAKRKTQTYWQGFVLWLRTKLLRIGGR